MGGMEDKDGEQDGRREVGGLKPEAIRVRRALAGQHSMLPHRTQQTQGKGQRLDPELHDLLLQLHGLRPSSTTTATATTTAAHPARGSAPTTTRKTTTKREGRRGQVQKGAHPPRCAVQPPARA